MRIDRDTGVIYGVPIVRAGVGKNGEFYSRDVLRRAVPKYEGVRVYFEHDLARPRQRRLQDQFGVLRNARFDGRAIIADLHANPHHPLFEQVAWDAENGTRGVGLSHLVDATDHRANGMTIVDSIDDVLSVDIVADPANVDSFTLPAPRLRAAQTGNVSADPSARLTAADVVARLTGRPSPSASRDLVRQFADVRNPTAGDRSPRDFINDISEAIET